MDAAGSAYVTGDDLLRDFPTTAGAFDTSLGGDVDAFVTKLAPSGASLVYSTYLGGSDYEGGRHRRRRRRERLRDGGSSSADFPTTPRTHNASRWTRS